MEANPNFNQFEHFDGHAHTQHHTTIYIEVARGNLGVGWNLWAQDLKGLSSITF